jgi:hypothetical protein
MVENGTALKRIENAGGWLVACDFAFARTRGSSAAIDPRRVEHRCVR